MNDGGKGSGRKDTPENAELVRKLRAIAEYEAQQRAAEKAKQLLRERRKKK